MERFAIARKVNSLFNKQQRIKIIFLIILLFIGMILEVFSLTMVIPLITSILEPDFKLLLTNYIGESIWLQNQSKNDLIQYIILILVSVFFIKMVFMVYLSYRQNKFIASVSGSIANLLYSKYLYSSYSFHLKRNNAELIRNLQQEVVFFSAFFQSYITFIVEVLLLLAVIITLIIIDPIGAISIGLFFSLMSYAFFQFTKKKLSYWGKERQELEGSVSKIILEGLGGIKEIKILGKESFFTKKYSTLNNLKFDINALFMTTNLTPRFYLEFMSIVALASFIGLLMFRGEELTTLITIIGVFIAAVFRLLPSVNKLISNLQIIKYKKYSLDIIIDELQLVSEENTKTSELDKKLTFNKSLTIKNLNFQYEDHTIIFNKLNFSLNKGEMVGIIGTSGAGKSTLIDIIMGLYKQANSAIYIDDYCIDNDVRSWQKNVGYVAQDTFFIDNSILKNIAFGLEENEIDVDRVKEVIKEAQLDAFIKTLPDGVNTTIGERGVQLSGGQQQRIGIARALYNNPEVLIFDEATSALDHITEDGILESITNMKRKKTIIMIAHRLRTLSQCDKVYEVGDKNIKIFKDNITLKYNAEK